MISVEQVLSHVQNELTDQSFERVALGEYLVFMNEIAMDIAELTRIWIGRYIATPTPLEMDYDDTVIYYVGDIVTYNNLFYISIYTSQGQVPPNPTYWREATEWDSGTSYAVNDYVYWNYPKVYYKALAVNSNIEPPNDDYWYVIGDTSLYQHKVNIPYTDLDGNTIAPFKFLRVSRGNSHDGYMNTEEYSLQSIGRYTSDRPAFLPNDITHDANSFSTQFLNDINPLSPTIDNGLTLNFAEPFQTNEQVVIDFVQGKPFTITKWGTNPSLLIPDFMRNAFIWGVLWRAMSRLYNNGDDRMFPRMQNAELKYQGLRFQGTLGKVGGYLREAMGYARNFKDIGSSMAPQPLKYLPRTKDFR